MDFDYSKEEQGFLSELSAGKFGIERMPNTADDYLEKEDNSVKAYGDYLVSESFKSLNSKAAGQ